MQLGTCVECGRESARNSNKCPEHEAVAQARNRRGVIDLEDPANCGGRCGYRSGFWILPP